MGQWLPVPCNGGPCARAATRKPTERPRGLTQNSRAGNPKRTRPKLPPNRVLSNQRGLQRTKRGGGPKTPLCEGKGPENPGVVAPFAVADCRGNRRYGTCGRSQTSSFSSPSRATLSGPATPQILPLCSGVLGESSVDVRMLWGTGREAQRRLNFGAVSIFAVSTATSSLWSTCKSCSLETPDTWTTS